MAPDTSAHSSTESDLLRSFMSSPSYTHPGMRKLTEKEETTLSKGCKVVATSKGKRVLMLVLVCGVMFLEARNLVAQSVLNSDTFGLLITSSRKVSSRVAFPPCTVTFWSSTNIPAKQVPKRLRHERAKKDAAQFQPSDHLPIVKKNQKKLGMFCIHTFSLHVLAPLHSFSHHIYKTSKIATNIYAPAKRLMHFVV